MRISPIDVSAASAPTGAGGSRADQGSGQTSSANPSSGRRTPVADLPPQREVNVVMEDNHTIYRFLDQQTGDLIQQVPPEELLRVMRTIADLLQQSEQKSKPSS